MQNASSFKEGSLGNGNITIGRFTHGYEELLTSESGEAANVSIGSFCYISSGVEICLGGIPRADRITAFPFGHIFQEELGGEGIEGYPYTNGDVSIGNDVWIGSDAKIMSGVTIGDGAVIAPNSLVTADVGPYEIWGGNPAELIRPRFEPDVITALLKLKWWNLPEKLITEMAPLLSTAPTLELLSGIQGIVDDLVRFDTDEVA